MVELAKKSKEERREYYRTHYYSYDDRLVLKVVGKRCYILRFLKDIHSLYPANAINVSPIKSDNVNPTQTVYINIFYAQMDNAKKQTSPVQSLEPPEEPPLDKEV